VNLDEIGMSAKMPDAIDEVRARRSGDPAWQRSTVGRVLAEHAGVRPEHPFLISWDDDGNRRQVSYREMREASARLAAGLRNVGVDRGDRVAVWMTNSPQYVIAYFAVLRLGAVLVPINTYLGADEVGYILRSARCRQLIVMDRFRHVDFSARLQQLAPEWTGSSGALESSSLPDLRNVMLVRRSADGSGDADDLMTLIATRTPDDSDEASHPDDLAIINYTSGSTGRAKGVCLHQWGLVANGHLHDRRLDIGPDDRWFTQMPLFHVGASIWGLMSMLAVGGTLVLGETNNAAQAARAIERERCTIYNGAPAMQYDLLESLAAAPADLSSVRFAMHRVDERLRRELWAPHGVRLFSRSFGLTETYGPALSYLQDGPSNSDDIRELGFPLDGVEVRIVDPATGIDLGNGVMGEVLLRGMVTSGYYEMPEQTELAIDSDGWFHTRDLAVRRPDGSHYFVGRIKLMLKVGGENVAIEEVEQVVSEVDGVREVCVVGTPDERFGEVPVAFLSPVADADLDIELVRVAVARRLAHFKVPRRFVVLPQLPATGTGKVDRSALERLALGDEDRSLSR
jgi:fatty-acyl-CoA synthase